MLKVVFSNDVFLSQLNFLDQAFLPICLIKKFDQRKFSNQGKMFSAAKFPELQKFTGQKMFCTWPIFWHNSYPLSQQMFLAGLLNKIFWLNKSFPSHYLTEVFMSNHGFLAQSPNKIFSSKNAFWLNRFFCQFAQGNFLVQPNFLIHLHNKTF